MSSSAPPPSSTPTSGRPVILNVPDPLRVQVTHPEKPQRPSVRLLRRWRWFFFSVPAVFLFWLWFFYLFPRHAVSVSCDLPLVGLGADVSYPSYLANGDEGEIRITLDYTPAPVPRSAIGNTPTPSPTLTQSITPTATITTTPLLTTTVLVQFDGPVHIDPETPNRIRLEGLAPGERHTAAVRFSLNQEARLLEWKTLSSPAAPISFALWVEETAQYCVDVKDGQEHSWAIGLAPLYSQSRLLLYLFGTAGVGLAGFLWSQMRKWLGYD